MNVIEPLKITDTNLFSSNVAETDFPFWSAATAYAIGAKVTVLSNHSNYEAVVANTNLNPANDTSGSWLKLGATNRWKAFDEQISDPVVKSGTIEYQIKPVAIADSVAFFGLEAASIEVMMTNSSGTEVYRKAVQLADRSGSVEWFSWLYDEVEYDTEAMVLNFPGFSGNTIRIRVVGGSSTKVGQIVLGKNRTLGECLEGSSTGIEDYSRKERDAFGNAFLLERAFADTVSFQFSFPPADARRIKRILSNLRASPAVYYAGEDTNQFGTTVYGFYQNFDIPLTTGMSFATLEIEGLT